MDISLILTAVIFCVTLSVLLSPKGYANGVTIPIHVLDVIFLVVVIADSDTEGFSRQTIPFAGNIISVLTVLTILLLVWQIGALIIKRKTALLINAVFYSAIVSAVFLTPRMLWQVDIIPENTIAHTLSFFLTVIAISISYIYIFNRFSITANSVEPDTYDPDDYDIDSTVNPFNKE